jgi:hypothetical protein
MASSQYVWVFSNRRRLLPDAVSKVSNLLAKYKPDLLLLNNDSTQMSKTPVSAKRFKSLRDVFLQSVSSVGTYGLQVLPAKAWKSEYLKKYLEDERYTGCILYCTFDYLASLPIINVISWEEPLVSATQEWDSWWANKHFEMWTNVRNSVNSLPKLAWEDKRLMLKSWARTGYFSIRTLSLLRAKRLYNEKIFNLYMEDFLEYSNVPLSIVISKMPIWFVRLCSALYSVGRGSLRSFIPSRYAMNPLSAR